MAVSSVGRTHPLPTLTFNASACDQNEQSSGEQMILICIDCEQPRSTSRLRNGCRLVRSLRWMEEDLSLESTRITLLV